MFEERPKSVGFLASACLGLLAACTSVVPPPAAVAAPERPLAALEARQRLFKLFADSDEALLRRDPLSALARGDLRFAGQFGDYISDAYYAAERSAAEAELAALGTIDRSALGPTDQLAHDVFAFNARQRLATYSPELVALTAVRPLDHFTGLHSYYPTLSSGSGIAPFKTVTDYENNIRRLGGYARYLDQAIGRFRQGMASGVVDTKLTVRNMIEQLGTQLGQKPADSPFFAPLRAFPESVGKTDRERLDAATRAVISDTVYPAMGRLRAFLKDEYLPAARDGVGLLAMKGGDRLYRHLIREHTTLALEPEDIHRIGIDEVARITSEMERIKTAVGFAGTLAQFFDHLRTDPRFKMASREALTAGYYAIGRKVDAAVPRLFSKMPRSRLEIRPYEEFREKFEAGGGYERGTPDGNRPGVFYFNAYDLPSRTTPGMTTLYLHEGAPGHHFQISLAQENPALPAFMRFGGNTAFVEGWALYAEKLGFEMGLYDDPYQRFGTLSDEMLRAMRLVVDTGLHAKGWSRDQAIAYMLSHSDMGRTDATAEVERYIAMPGQALAYKIGALAIQRLRAKAQSELDPRFDVRDFHDQLLTSGALPLPILEQKIDRWIAEKKAG